MSGNLIQPPPGFEHLGPRVRSPEPPEVVVLFDQERTFDESMMTLDEERALEDARAAARAAAPPLLPLETVEPDSTVRSVPEGAPPPPPMADAEPPTATAITPQPEHLQRSGYHPDVDQQRLMPTRRLEHLAMPYFSAPTLSEVERQMFDWALEEGFMLKRRSSIRRCSGRGQPEKHYLIYQCLRGSRYRDTVGPETRQRRARTGLTGCRYAVKVHLIYLEDRTRYRVVGHTLDPESHTHNHPVLEPGDSYLMRPLSDEIARQIKTLSRADLTPVQIFRHLRRQYPSETMETILSDIRRYCRRARAEERCGVGPSEHLRRFLTERADEDGILYRIDQRVDDDTLFGVLWSTRTARTLLHRFPTVLAVDVTYNGDRHAHKILHVSGVSATNMSFTVALAAMPDESEESVTRYLRFMLDLMGDVRPAVVVTDRSHPIRNAVAAVWPAPDTKNVYCIWHILQNLKEGIAEAISVYRRAAPSDPKATQPRAEAVPEAEEGSEGDRLPSGVSSDEAEGVEAEVGLESMSEAEGPVDLRSLHVLSSQGHVMTKSDWTDVSKEMRTSFLQLVVQAQTEPELQNGLETWEAMWREPRYRGILDEPVEQGLRYVEDDGDGFVHVHINRFLHLNHRTTSRLEALHASLRSYIGSRARRRRLAVNDLVLYSLDKFHSQWPDIRAAMDYQISHRPSENAHTLFHAVRTVVSEYAINKLRNQVSIARNIVLREQGERRRPDGRPIPETKPCTGQFRTSLGLPCAHDIAEVSNTRDGGSGVLDVSQFHPQWWLSSSSWMENLMATLNERIANASGLADVEIVDEGGTRRLREPVTVAARREAGGGTGTQASQRRERRGPRTSTGRLLTTAEIALGGPDEPETPLCQTCRRRHHPDHPCRETLEARAAVERSQRRSRQNADAAWDSDDDPYDYDSDYDDVHPRYLVLAPRDAEGCPFCSKNHTRRWCKRMYSWRKWYNDSQRGRAPTPPAEFVSASEGGSEAAEGAAEAFRTVEGALSVPATPNRDWADPLDRLMPSPTPFEDNLSIDNIAGYAAALERERLGSIHHEWMAEQPLQEYMTQPDLPETPETVIPETQFEVSNAENAEVARAASDMETAPESAVESGGAVICEGQSAAKRRRCSP